MICLMPNCCFLSETSRMLEIYRALRERGDSAASAPGAAGIKVVTHGGPYESLLRAAGVPYDVLGPGVSTRRYQEFLGVEPVPSFAALLLGDLTLVTDVPEVLGLARAEVDGWTPRDPRRYGVGDAEVPRLVHLVRREGRLAGVDSPVVRLCRGIPDEVGRGLLGRAGARAEQPGSMHLCRRHQRPGHPAAAAVLAGSGFSTPAPAAPPGRSCREGGNERGRSA